MGDSESKRIVLVGAGGMAFGPVMVYDAMHAEKVKGSTLVLFDLSEKRLDLVDAAARRMNEDMGRPLKIESVTEPGRALEGADFALISAEFKRWESWKQDFEVPLKYGARHIMGENGGPGAVFHSARSIKNVLSICEEIQKYAPNAFVVNLTNPMSRVTLAIERYTKLKNVGLCHEFMGGLLRLAAFLFVPPSRIDAEASGMNHFTWFHKIRNAETGEDYYPKMQWHIKAFPWLHQPLVRDSFHRYGLYSTTSDSHLGEYLPYTMDVHKQPKVPYNSFFAAESKIRERAVELYSRGLLPIPAKILPRSGEEAFKIIEAMASGERAEIDAINVVNSDGSIPNLPKGMIVEVPGYADADGVHPKSVPPIIESLAQIMRDQFELQSLVADASFKGDAKLAFEALKRDPHSPGDEESCRKMFDELRGLQAEFLPF